MVEYNKVNVELSDSQLNKLNSGVKNQTGVKPGQNEKNKTLKFLISFLCLTICFLRAFQQIKPLKKLQMFLVEIKNIFVEKTFSFDYFCFAISFSSVTRHLI